MRLVAVAQMFNENTYIGFDGKTNLERFMDSISKYCDGLVIYNDGSTDDSRDLALSYQGQGTLETVEVIGDKDNDFKNELYHKARLLEHSRRLNPDWLLWLDCDEVIEPMGERGGINFLIENSKGDGINLFNRNLWRSEKFYRVDELWAQGLFCRLWKYSDKLSYDIKPGLHHRLSPNGIENYEDATNIHVIHYGYVSDDAIVRKYNMYKSHGQSGNSLSRMVNENGLRVVRSPAKWFEKAAAGPDEEVFNKPLVSLI